MTVALAALDQISDKLASRPLPQSVRLGTDEGSSFQAMSGLSAADAEIVQSLLQFYDQFAAKNAAGSAVDFVTARVHRRIGDIRARLGQYDRAESAFRQAVDTVGELRHAQPADAALLSFEVQTCNARGAALLKAGDFQRAIESHRQALERLAAGTSSSMKQRDLRYEQALTLAGLVSARSAEFLDQQHRRGPHRPSQDAPPTAPPEIQAEFQQVIQLLHGLLQDAPENTRYLLALARCHRSILPVAWANADQQAAKDAKQQALGIFQRLVAQNPDDLTLQFELADTLAMTAQAETRQPLPDADLAALNQSLQLATNLHAKRPTALEYAILQANVQQRLGEHFTAAKRWSDAQDHLTRAADEFGLLVTSSPTNPLFQTSLTRVRWELADSLRRQGALAASRALLEKAIAEYAGFRDSEAGRRVSAGLLVGLHRELARVLEQLGEHQLASEASQTADRLRDQSR